MKKRVYGWDIIRIVLILIIFAFHSNIHLNLSYGYFNDFISVGACVMTSFFILSGVVASYSNCVFENTNDIKNYYKKKIIAVFPLYWCFCILYWVVNRTTLNDLLMLPVSILGIQSFYPGSFSIGHNVGTWFVSCLLCCYAIYPIVIMIINKKK